MERVSVCVCVLFLDMSAGVTYIVSVLRSSASEEQRVQALRTAGIRSVKALHFPSTQPQRAHAAQRPLLAVTHVCLCLCPCPCLSVCLFCWGVQPSGSRVTR